MKYLWIGGAVLLIVAALSTWFAFQRADFVAGLVSVAAAALWKAIGPELLKRKTPEQEAADHAAYRRGETVPTRHRPHPGER